MAVKRRRSQGRSPTHVWRIPLRCAGVRLLCARALLLSVLETSDISLPVGFRPSDGDVFGNKDWATKRCPEKRARTSDLRGSCGSPPRTWQ